MSSVLPFCLGLGFPSWHACVLNLQTMTMTIIIELYDLDLLGISISRLLTYSQHFHTRTLWHSSLKQAIHGNLDPHWCYWCTIDKKLSHCLHPLPSSHLTADRLGREITRSGGETKTALAGLFLCF